MPDYKFYETPAPEPVVHQPARIVARDRDGCEQGSSEWICTGCHRIWPCPDRTPRPPVSDAIGILGTDYLGGEDPVDYVRRLRDRA